MYDIIVVGAGPAGLSAAIYGQRGGKKVLVLEQKQYGGQIVVTPQIENYPGLYGVSGFEFSMKLVEQAKELGAEIRMEQVLSIDENRVVTTDRGSYQAGAVIIASGVTKRKLGLPKESELTGAGVSYCATCDGMFFRGKDVAVNGGGNTALEDALFLSNYCNRVYVIHRRDQFRGEQRLVDLLTVKENVVFMTDSVITGLVGTTVLEKILIKNKKTDTECELEVSGLFVAIGQEPDSEIFKGIVDIDDFGYIIADESCKTSCQGIFVAGDCRTKKIRQLTTATADGTIAALSACEFLG